jgi:hypothetical protein
MKTRESATDDQLKNNVLTNLQLISDWTADRYEIHDKTANLVTFGQSFKKDPEGMLDNMGKGDIFCVKHTLPLFKDTKYKPKFCVILDPREAEGTSTLGHKRADLLEVYPETIYLVASMTHPSMTMTLLDRGAHVVGWHSACEAMRDPQVAQMVRRWITGGSCSAMRAVSLAKIFGYRKINLGGYDCVVEEPEEYKQIRQAQVQTILDASGTEVPEELRGVVTDTLFPAFEMFGAKKVANLIKQGQSPEDRKDESLINIVDNFAVNNEMKAMKIAIDDKIMWVSPELAAMSQDIERIFKSNIDIVYNVYGEGVATALWETLGGAEKINPQTKRQLNELFKKQ